MQIGVSISARAHARDHADAGEVRHHHVEHHHARAILLHQLERRVPAVGHAHGKALESQRALEGFADVLVVVDDEDQWFRRHGNDTTADLRRKPPVAQAPRESCPATRSRRRRRGVLEATALPGPTGTARAATAGAAEPMEPELRHACRVVDAGQDPVGLLAGQPFGVDRFLDLLLCGCLHRGAHVVTALAELLGERVGELVALLLHLRPRRAPPARGRRGGAGPGRTASSASRSLASVTPSSSASVERCSPGGPMTCSRRSPCRFSLCVPLPPPPSRLLPDVAAPDTDTTMPSTSTDIAAIHFHPGLIEAPSRLLPGDLFTGSRASFGPVLVGSL